MSEQVDSKRLRWLAGVHLNVANHDGLSEEDLSRQFANEGARAADELDALRAQVAKLTAERENLKRLIESLTPGGSEFHDAPETCVEWVRRRLASAVSEVQKRKRLDGYKCRICNSPDHLEVHHRSYDHIFDERMEDLTTLCATDHWLVTAYEKGLIRLPARPKSDKPAMPGRRNGREVVYLEPITIG